MVEVTEADRDAVTNFMGAIFESAPSSQTILETLEQAFARHRATHRETAAKAERDRLRNLPDETALEVWINLPAKYEGISKEAMRAMATALADALESQHD